MSMSNKGFCIAGEDYKLTLPESKDMCNSTWLFFSPQLRGMISKTTGKVTE